jgi:hypothetical protein
MPKPPKYYDSQKCVLDHNTMNCEMCDYSQHLQNHYFYSLKWLFVRLIDDLIITFRNKDFIFISLSQLLNT